MGTGNARFRSTRGWAGVPWSAHRACLEGTRGENTPCLGVPKDGTGHDRGTQGGDKLGKAHSRGGPAWLPGAVGHGLSGRDLEQRPAEVRGSRPTPRWEPQASAQGARGGGGRRIPGREVLGQAAPRSFVARSSPGGRAPSPPAPAPRRPRLPGSFHLRKNFPGTWVAASLQPSAPGRPAHMLMRPNRTCPLAKDAVRGGVMQISPGAPGGDWLKSYEAAWEARRAGCGRVRQVRLRSDALGTNRRRLAASYEAELLKGPEVPVLTPEPRCGNEDRSHR